MNKIKFFVLVLALVLINSTANAANLDSLIQKSKLKALKNLILK